VSRGGHTPSPIWEATPPHPRTSSLCVSRTLRNPAARAGACSREQTLPVYVCAYVYAAFTRDCRYCRCRRWTLRALSAHARERIRAARHGVQKGRDWQCRGPTCPLPQHGHAPRGSTWLFSSSGWCATVKPALQILRGIHSAGADATNKSCIMEPYLHVRWRTYVGLFRYRWCATMFFSKIIIKECQGMLNEKTHSF